jgi:hypothetical protein
MQVWLLCVLLFFGAAEFYQWVQGFTLPMPVFVLAGALLAVASNFDKFPSKGATPSSAPQPGAVPPVSKPSASEALTQSSLPLPETSPQTARSISFTIRKPRTARKEVMREPTDQRES